MTADPNKVKKLIEKALPGSIVKVENKTRDGLHFDIDVAYSGFKGKSLVEQHKMIHDSIKPVRNDMHAVVIKTSLLEKAWREKDLGKEKQEKPSDLREMIRQAISHNDVAVFIKGTPQQPLCGFSARVVGILNELGVKYKAVNIFDDINIKPTLVEMTGWPTTPQVFIKGTLIGGCDITEEMYMNGELQKMLKEAKILA